MKKNAYSLFSRLVVCVVAAGLAFAGCKSNKAPQSEETASRGEYLSEPLVKDIYTADPSAHVFNDTLYISFARYRIRDKGG